MIVMLLVLISASAAAQLNVATYNIRLDKDTDRVQGDGWEKRCPKICDLVRYHGFHLFGAQEVLRNQLDDMLELLPGYGYVGVAREDGKEKGEYVPIFYDKEKMKVLKSGCFWLSETPDVPSVGWDAHCYRIVTYAKMRVRGTGKVFWCFNTHFDHRGQTARYNSVDLLAGKIARIAGREPFILLGDFNTDQNSVDYGRLKAIEGLGDSYDLAEIRMGWCGTANNFENDVVTDSRFDHIFVSRRFRVSRYAVLTDSYRDVAVEEEFTRSNFPEEIKFLNSVIRFPSDHYPVCVELRVR